MRILETSAEADSGDWEEKFQGTSNRSWRVPHLSRFDFLQGLPFIYLSLEAGARARQGVLSYKLVSETLHGGPACTNNERLLLSPLARWQHVILARAPAGDC